MSEQINDGGPAFPTMMWDETSRQDVQLCGMSLRDYFAGQALCGLCANLYALTDVQRNQYPNKRLEELAALLSFEAADAMIKARNL